MEFHISRKARDKYKLEDSLFKLTGNIVFPDFERVQHFAGQLEDKNARAGEVNALGLMHEVFHQVARSYRQQKNPGVMDKAVKLLQEHLGDDALEEALRKFAEEFPPSAIYRGESSIDEFMEGSTDDLNHRQVLLEEMMMLWLANINPACEPYKNELFDDAPLKDKTAYQPIIEQMEHFFSGQPFFGPCDENLVAMLRAPSIAVPDSLTGQLEYIKEHWGLLLGDFMTQLLSGLDLLKEEEKFAGAGPGKTEVYDFSNISFEEEYESFSSDHAWMPRLVLIAKSTHVWLDQLSRKYKRSITRLDQIPDEELKELAHRGFTGLWLIGVWERSSASREIKRKCGNPEALASAYSIYQYRIADDLGGEEALNNLKHRAWQSGLRIGSDMVPNHMGIDSPWVVEHPDWFLSLDYCPYPSYSFTGDDLSSDSRVSIYLEDHYYDRTDAAVVFKWVNNQTGEVRYIYHGNDGTTMPWNDTAQLNYLNPEVREAVTNTIFEVSRQFPIIRFDAAMTLTKRHYQRLWFPEPGSGGDIPTRAGKGMSKIQFSSQMPEEFWRQIVDRFAEADSDTLLLAEAFWLMETYFVRTLGMHRVYNSAFMNFLKNEENDQFRSSIKNVLQFNPEILKRFVNFINNPDEETAVAQFGKDDKYFGVCTLMATLPGLPMFGHGQIEGFSEKYGMEYKKAYWDEIPDQLLIQRHEKEIFPLLRKRYLFAEVDQFLLYDFYTPEGWVNENVIAFSNRVGDERCLVLYHNSYAETSGRLKISVPYTIKHEDREETAQKSLAEALNLTPGDNYYTIFRDSLTGLEYIRQNNQLMDAGLFVEMKAYKCKVFMDFREVEDDERRVFSRLTTMLKGAGVPSVMEVMRKHFENPLRKPFQELLSPELFQRLDRARTGNDSLADVLEEIEIKMDDFFQAVQNLTGTGRDASAQAVRLLPMVSRLVSFRQWKEKLSEESLQPEGTEKALRALRYASHLIRKQPFLKSLLYSWICILGMKQMTVKDTDDDAGARRVWSMLEDWLLTETIADFFKAQGADPQIISRQIRLLHFLVRYGEWEIFLDDVLRPGSQFDEDYDTADWFDDFFSDPEVRKLLQVNTHNGIQWFNKESAEEMAEVLYMASVLAPVLDSLPLLSAIPVQEPYLAQLNKCYRSAQFLTVSIRRSGYKLDQLKRLFRREE